MTCEECGVGEAVVHLTRVVEGKAAERRLCLECAEVAAGASRGGDIREVLQAWVEREAGKERKD